MKQYQEAVKELEAAIVAHAHARLELDEALAELEAARARAVLEGLEGKNETARKAELAAKTEKEEHRVRTARRALIETEARLELAKVRERHQRIAALAAAGIERAA
jgi:hypothetical protein